jgi:single-strand DNA-binding protein
MNQVLLIGRLVAEPEGTQLQSGMTKASMRIAVDREISREKKEAGEVASDFINLVAWGKTAEFAINYLGKGRLIAVSGKLQIRDYMTKEGEKRTIAEVVAEKLKGLDRAPENAGNGNSGGGSYSRPAQDGQPYRQAQAPVQRQARPMPMDDISDPFDDAPAGGNPFA